ncbi:MAG: nucleotidyltransferase domain-containing protein [Chitinophagales bacterium]|nr:nucleotidyltransferase domain-containing protein [Chitinophagales bacterium]
MIITGLIRARYDGLLSLCKAHKVKRLYAFGSSVTGNFDSGTSDIDLQVEIEEKDPIEKGDLLLHFFTEIEKLFNRRVDLLTDQPIENPYLKASVEKNKVLIYDGEREKVLV